MSLAGAAAAQDASGSVDAVIVTGTRNSNRTVTTRISPIDVTASHALATPVKP